MIIDPGVLQILSVDDVALLRVQISTMEDADIQENLRITAITIEMLEEEAKARGLEGWDGVRNSNCNG